MRAAQKKSARRKPNRKGQPLLIYFSSEQAERLSTLSKERLVPKASVVRFAVDKLFRELEAQQLELPLGL
jgi:predicted DNA-binding protein